MQTRRQYLVGLGLAKDGRGKLSRAAHEAINKAVSEGMQFSDLQDKPVVVKRERASKPKDANESVTVINQYAGEARRYPSDKMFSGKDSSGKTHRVNARQACYHSPYSIAGCFTCSGAHRVLVSGGEWIDVTEE